MQVSLGSLLVDHPAALDDPLVHSDGHVHTKADLLGAVAEVTSELRGCAAGSPVVIVGEGVDVLVAMFAAWTAGLVAVPVNPRLPGSALREMIDRCDPVAIVRSGTATLRASTTVHPAGSALVLWTSGTTGPPKPILHHHGAYLEIVDRVLAPLSADRDRTRTPSPNLIPVPMTLNAGIYSALFGLRAGSPLVLMERFETATFAALVRRHGIRSTVLPPAAIAMLNADEELGDLKPLRYVRSITAPLSPFHARRFHDRFGVFVLNGYGQAEIGEVIGWIASDAKSHPERIGAIGRPHPGVSIRLENPDDHGIGELCVRPPVPVAATVAAALGDRLDADGYVRTGDLACIDDLGFVWIEGRINDLINRGGNKIHPAEVEEVLAAISGVEDVAIVGVADDRLGEVPLAFFVGDVAVAELVGACRTHLVPYKIPVGFERVGEIPRNEAGKILRRELRTRPGTSP